MSSTWRELKALYYTLQGLQHTAAHKNIKWFMDNRGAVSILRIGSRKRNLHALALDILDTCQQLHCTLHTQWVPRDRNWLADELSRGPDRDDWGLIYDHFKALNDLWGPYEIDRFASFKNAKCYRFNSKLPDYGSEAVDAFSQDWSAENNWFCPPVSLIAKVLQQCAAQQARGTLIVPYWPSYFWPLIQFTKGEFVNFVIEQTISWYIQERKRS